MINNHGTKGISTALAHPALCTANCLLGWVSSIAISHDSALVASGAYDHTVKLWSVESGSVLRTLTGHKGECRAFLDYVYCCLSKCNF